MKDSERIKRIKKYMDSACPACGDPIHLCNENPDTNHYELVIDPDTGEVVGETERIFRGKKMGGVEGKAEDKNAESNLKLKKEGKKDMFDLTNYEPDKSDKHFTVEMCLHTNALTFLELASEKAFELLGDDEKENRHEELEELKYLFSEVKTSLIASQDIRF